MIKAVIKTAVGLVCAALTMHAQAQTNPQTWRIGVADHVYPFSYVDKASGQQIGFDVDMAKAICHDMKWQCEIVPMRYVDLRDALVANELQMVINGWRKVTERMQTFAFTEPYYRSQIIFVTTNPAIRNVTPETIGQLRIGVLINSGQSVMVQQHYLKQGATLHEYPSSTTLYQAVQNGEVDVVCLSGFAGYEYLKQSENHQLRIVGIHRDLDPKFAGRRIAVNQAYADHIPAINKALMNIKTDGRYQAINLRYFEFMVY